MKIEKLKVIEWPVYQYLWNEVRDIRYPDIQVLFDKINELVDAHNRQEEINDALLDYLDSLPWETKPLRNLYEKLRWIEPTQD